jgi:hypothetical protein
VQSVLAQSSEPVTAERAVTAQCLDDTSGGGDTGCSSNDTSSTNDETGLGLKVVHNLFGTLRPLTHIYLSVKGDAPKL